MKSLRKLICIITILLLANCTNKQKKSQTLQVIDIEDSIDKMEVWNLSHFASRIKYIALETKIDNFLSYIQDYIETDKYLIVKNFKQLMLFDMDGRFIRQIGNNGRGPGEYQFVNSMGIINDSILTMQSLYDLINYRIDGSFGFSVYKMLVK